MPSTGSAPTGNIVLVGFMGSGKSEVGRSLAERTKRKLVDIDSLVEAEGASIAEIFAAEGERGFRRRERRTIERVSRARNAVIATGGGAVLDAANVRNLKRSGVVVYLKTGVDELVRRLEGTDRPLLRPAEGPPTRTELRKRVGSLLADRTPLYEGASDHVVACEGRRPAEVADEIVRRLEQVADTSAETAKVRRVRVATSSPYSVVVGRGLLGRLPELVKLPAGAEKVCLVSHPRIRRLWGAALERSFKGRRVAPTWWTFPEGEERKTIETAARLVRAMAKAGLHRGDVVVALGGGVVGDLAGFAASTYARGVAFVQVPTTLLAMVDAAIGGKTGVNLPQGKNLVGTFHQPLGVVADVDVLTTLPERELRGGLAEVVKYGFIADPPLAELVVRERDEILERRADLETLVARCARTKASIVAADERETGRRAVLNYGHTLGHALEGLSVAGRLRGGQKLHHGEAIAIGMVYAAAVSQLAGRVAGDLVADHRRVLEAVGLPTGIDGVGWSEVRERMGMDKKYAKGVRLVILEGLGKPVVRTVPEKTLKRAFAEVSS
ncbi:MAG: 3-dehydroquinate synthase [Actinomycetota bacterium]